jgi:hypothetical protein
MGSDVWMAAVVDSLDQTIAGAARVLESTLKRVKAMSFMMDCTRERLEV